MNIGEKFKLIRANHKLTQEDFAYKVGISRSTLAQIENNNTNPTFQAISNLCSQFKIDANLLYDESKNIEQNDNKIDNINDNKIDVPFEKIEVQEHLRQNVLRNREFYQSEYDTLDKYSEIAFTPVNSSKKLQERVAYIEGLRDKYTKLIKRELHIDHKQLFNLLVLIEKFDALLNLITDINYDYINNPPDPFFTDQYIDYKNRTENVPNTLDYSKFKNDFINWLEQVKEYEEVIKIFYDQGEAFLNATKPIKDLPILNNRSQ